ncbi:hypothetical protein LCGC14_0351730 [marine sediment metagenome]|uniref:RanBP2-type domain-containing protein n=1 Tax=marine sediment metagenome TaxID=412755 RepID=A0A0F9TGE8_9ZZZZ
MNKQTSKGWECPKCSRVNAIWVSTCPCYKKPEPKTEEEWKAKHEHIPM